MRIAVVGAGTVIFRDEGVGVYAQRYLQENYEFDGNVTLVDGGVLGFQLMTYYTDYDKVIILDTITMKNEAPGTLFNIPGEELLGLGSYKQTAHEVEIVEMLEIAALNGNLSDVHIIGIVPEDILSVKAGLSETLKKAFFDFIAEALRELERSGVTYREKRSGMPLNEVISCYAEPTAPRFVPQ
ncbi:HyaD/HybD family hydrogenase maturation endopeptidase [Hydrogenimonas urashimensis]|uniref:HyaD/HybD family hydrogenase maturation endopeptidase n=1 Tax=Hydrogenimonas urashimensis TaxID=2740515 RepID=UPI0019160019|nr:HyaD/HybD family hydrogenase maturation endopeptidase [Hydrogenimonas urashimensis]